MVINVPVVVLETFVYHSGKKRYTENNNNMTGRLNKTAIGNPLSNFPANLLCFSLSRSQ